MAKTIYSHELRTLLCSNCGAPVEVALAGGAAKCKYCGAVQQVERRDESADIEQAAQAPPMGESERLAMLRSQDANPSPLPAGLEGYVSGGEIQPHLVDEALGYWQQTRQQVRDGAPFPDQDRLYYLTVLLVRGVDDRTRRPLLESALELLPDVRHRHVLRCSLVEHAAVAGDREAARQWLRPCNPHPTDLQMDTAYRVAAACLAAAERDYSKVFTLLGTRPDDIPLADEAEAKAELLRCDAVERKWGAATATEQLTSTILSNPRRLYEFERAAKELAALQPCPQSAAAAASAGWQAVDTRLRPVDQGSSGCLLLGLLIPIGGLVLSIAGGIGLLGDDPAVRVNLVVHPMIWLVVTPTILIGVVYHMRKKKQRLREHGQLGLARVVSSTRRVQHSKNSSTVVQVVAAHVQVGDHAVAISKTVTRSDPVPLGVYPCLFDPDAPDHIEMQLRPLA